MRNIKSQISLCIFAASTIGLAVTTPAQAAQDANGTCLIALFSERKVQVARNYPGSVADITSIKSVKKTPQGVKVSWVLNVMMPKGNTKSVLRGSCLTTADGKRLKAITYGK